MFTLEIGGRPAVVTNAESQDGADDLFRSEWLKADLHVFQSDGKPLWNGEDLFVRRAFPEEVARFDAGRSGDADDDENYVVFLVPVSRLGLMPKLG